MLFPANQSDPTTPSQSQAPVGIFDSGVGGLSVLRAIHHLLPYESLLYCADTAHIPYGDHSAAFVTDRTLAIGDWLVAQGVKAIVVACNTATTQSISALRDHLTIPVIGVEPGVKPAALQSLSRVAGVLATAGTLKSDKFQKLAELYASNCTLICVAGVGLVEAIESGDLDSPALSNLLDSYLRPMLDAGADTLALGCTHYPFLIPLIKQLAGDRLTIIDNSQPVAKQLERTLTTHGLLHSGSALSASGDAPNTKPAKPELHFVTTGASHQLARLIHIGLALRVEVTRVTIASSSLGCQA